MAYFTSKGYLHRDLAARNVLVTETMPTRHKVAKVADFGLCRHLDKDVYTTKGGRLPIKWMAIEALEHGDFSVKSDVWSFAVMLWEAYSYGRTPLANIEPRDVLPYLTEGNRLLKPDECPDEVFASMRDCWLADRDRRPTFEELRTRLYSLVDQNNSYYDVTTLQPASPTNSLNYVIPAQSPSSSSASPRSPAAVYQNTVARFSLESTRTESECPSSADMPPCTPAPDLTGYAITADLENTTKV